MSSMIVVGEILKNSRERKKIKIEKVAKDLNISIHLLKSIEDNKIPTDLNKVYLVGYIRTYSDYLNLDSNEIVSQFKNINKFDNKIISQELPKPILSNNFFSFSKNIAMISLVFFGFTFYFLFFNSENNEPSYSIIPDIPENLQSKIEENELKLDLKKKNIEKEIVKNENSDQVLINEEYIPQSSAIASIPNEESIEENIDNVTLRFLNPTWIQIRNIDNDIIFSKMMEKNDEYSYSISESYSLTTGNAGNILLLINDEVRGKVGKKGEVVESLIIYSDFSN